MMRQLERDSYIDDIATGAGDFQSAELLRTGIEDILEEALKSKDL